MKTKILDVISIFDIFEEYEKIKDPTSKNILEVINKAYDELIYNKGISYNLPDNNFTVEDAEDIADLIIDMADLICITLIRWYALDTYDGPYELPKDKLGKLRKHFSKILFVKGNREFLLNELLRFSFIAAYVTPVIKASDHRKRVLEEKQKTNPENN